MVNDTCLQCRRRPKRKKYQFCSPTCTERAAKAANKLILIPHDHVMFHDVSKTFRKNWKKLLMPRILDIYLITWTKKQRTTFDKYRARIGKKRKLKKGKYECKRFRSERRACRLGEGGNLNFCTFSDCHLCRAIKTGFGHSFDYKRQLKGRSGIRLGRGVYTSPTSSKAYDYALNTRNQSTVKAVIDTRIVLGKPHRTRVEEMYRMKAPKGSDSVISITGRGSVFLDKEICVYHKNSIRPAYLVMCQ